MRVTVKFVAANGEPDVGTADLATQLPGSPIAGQLITLNGSLYSVEDVVWNGDPQPMRRDDLTIWAKPR